MKKFSIILTLAIVAGCVGVPAQKTGKEGKPLPEFNLLLLDSTTWLNTQSIPTGKPVALFYFSPYCPHCNAEIQEIVEEMEDLKNIRFYFISNFPINVMKAFSKKYHLDKYPNIVSGIDTASFVQKYFNISGVPYTAIYDKDKKLNKTFMGPISSAQIQSEAQN